MKQIDQFFKWLQYEGRDEKTVKAYRTILGQFIEWYIGTTGQVNLSDVKPVTVKEFISYMKHIKNRKQATVNKSIAALKTFFAYLVDEGITKDNPMTRIKIQKVQINETVGESSVAKWLTKTEQERFVGYVEMENNNFKRLRNIAIINLMLYCGLRVSEVEDLKIEDIKVNGNIIITIREGKQGKYAAVTLLNKHSKHLRQWLTYRQSIGYEKYTTSSYLFISERSGKFGARGIQVMLKKYAEMANMKDITPHRFRHSFCKNLANGGAKIEQIRKLARHESIATTAIYIDPSYSEQLQALNNM
ncbi:tyrosine-type recombinase/integrase [Paenibacillus sp. V4I5]|uniref:tyrosine-type recombinase/integrase n=1 Tax=Paenibacillus sp. V4I5 TaxID=3042306 RepID=UPI00278DDEAE|nr:tyrosine-type recombinase/integrase [Paenibacillus sp. V4I5]MDQ0919159.1 site-specific recombinase XerD [Paenibacillus sp. V4I5]